jgi:hypothetical protein
LTPLLYEINTRRWLRELSERSGREVTLANVPEVEFAEWRRLGFTHIWLMGVWSSGPLARAEALAHAQLRRAYDQALPGWRETDVGGSPYAIADYHVSPALGGDEGLKIFRQKLREHGLRLLLDFVPNHVGLDHPWLAARPELFVQSPVAAPETFRQETVSGVRWLAHGKDPYSPAWTDTVQLDYRPAPAREAMLGVLQSIATRCDGVRCDMAMLVLSDVFAGTWKHFPPRDATRNTQHATRITHEDSAEFWSSAIPAVKSSHPDFLFLAEAYWGLEGRLQDLGFDYTYDKTLYDKLVGRDAPGTQSHLLGLPPGALASGAHFLENHDEPRIASLLSPAEHRAAALLILALPGLRFLHEGQLSGARTKLPVQLLRRPCEISNLKSEIQPLPSQISNPKSEIQRPPFQISNPKSEIQPPPLDPLYDQLLTILPATAVGDGLAELLRPRAAWAENPTFQKMIVIQWQKDAPDFDLAVVNLAPHRSQCYAPPTLSNLSAHNWSMKDLLGAEQYERDGDDLQAQGLYLDLPPYGAQLFHFTPIS